ncbi:LacI family DNA-binding transcriptional regulator [Microbacterium sp. M3]|uniref:LacI family DNA-binding transcriptional regulator n=1 Tax=Microbacterium arthrosphaerae TaxID=792652 RepID=A0ABU4H3U6_9MICO|nr:MULTISPECIES: LacI family DNA-binding transcriptional regulator [Microbacterium]MDW4573930.1 LacI family DNA-binding transcriptional regulator [Microbacterium arthrosphaerae]MDW7607785.1 LacI family DNA-binding transcriptional regulator [Microbacterium sp. M3]
MARARISDVAAAAGVSVTTVSLVMNDVESRISDETRQRVREAARAVGYAPNSVARGLRTQRTRTVGLISDQIATTPFAGRMLAGAQDAARDNGYLVYLIDTGGDAEIEREAIDALTAQQVDAMIYACMWHRIVDVPQGVSAKTVLLDCRPVKGGYRSVVPDDRAGGTAAVRELVAAGHRRIAYIDTDDGPIASRLRHEGYLEALAEAGIPADPALHITGDTSAHGGRAAAEVLLDLPDDERPTGIFCFNDRMAAGVYIAAHRRGLDIPRDLSVVGYDDQQLIAAEQDPPLTTVALPHYAMGRWAMEVALGVRAEGDEDATHLMECPVIRRDSVGPPPAQVAKPNRRRASHTERPPLAAPDR